MLRPLARDLAEIRWQIRLIHDQCAGAVQPAHEAAVDCGPVEQRKRVHQMLAALDAGVAQVGPGDREPVFV